MTPFDFSGLHTGQGFWFFLVQGIAVALTAVFPPLPAEFMVIASGAMAAEGTLPLLGAFMATFVGCLVGDIGLYVLFRYRVVHMLTRWAWGRRMHESILAASQRVGGASTWLGLLAVYAMPFGRSAAMATAAMTQMRWRRLISLACTGGIGWTWWLIALGYVPTLVTGLPPWASTIAGIGIGTAAGAVVAVIITRSTRSENAARSHESSESSTFSQ